MSADAAGGTPVADEGVAGVAEPTRIVDDSSVFADLYPGLRRFAGAIRPSHVEADDLIQEAVARTLRRRTLAELEDPGAYLRSAIVRLASNERRSWFRGRRAAERSRVVEPVDDARPSDLDDLMSLAPADRAVLYLSAVEGLSFAEVGDVVGCTEEAARTRASRARRRLRAELGAEDADDQNAEEST